MSAETNYDVYFTPQMYNRVADKLKKAMEGKSFYNTSSLDIEDIDEYGTMAQLTLTAVIYRDKVKYYDSGPEGGEITDVLPIWWDFNTFRPDDSDDFIDVTNNFQFSVLRELLIEV